MINCKNIIIVYSNYELLYIKYVNSINVNITMTFQARNFSVKFKLSTLVVKLTIVLQILPLNFLAVKISHEYPDILLLNDENSFLGSVMN